MIPLAKPSLGPEEEAAVAAVLRSGALTRGPVVQRFEEEFAEFCGAKAGVATSNGTTALHAALHAVGVRAGDEVVTTPFSFIASANAIRYCGATPVFADIDPRTFNIDAAAVARALTPRTKAVVVVHLFGQACDMGALGELCEERGVELVEDACQAHGAEWEGKRVGSFGSAAAFSFYPTKNMTTGEGGMVTTSDKGVAERAKLFVNHGQTEPYVHAEVGYNYRLPDVLAAIGREQLKKLAAFTRRRQENAALYNELLAKARGVTAPYTDPKARHVFHQYTVRAKERDALAKRLEDKGVGCKVFYPIPIHKQPAYASYGKQRLPNAERAAAEVLSIPVHPGVTAEQVRFVAGLL